MSTSSYLTSLLNIPVYASATTWAYDPEGHVVNEQAAVAGTTAGLKIVSSYDSRGRITQEQGFGHNTPAGGPGLYPQ